MKIMVTGTSGMVGKSLLSALRQQQQNTVLAPTRSELNLLNKQDVADYMKENCPDMVVHLAAKVGGIHANMTLPVDFLTENIWINTHVIHGALQAGVPKLINMGSSCMYPKDRELLHETDLLSGRLEPTNEGYALAKLAASMLCESINQQYGLQFKTIIPCNLYGPHDNFDLMSSHMLPAAIRKIHEAKVQRSPEVVIWGDGQARREFLYVDDLVQFIVQAIPRIEEMPDIVNVGLGHDYTIEEYYRAAAKVIGFQGKFTFDLARPAGMRCKLIDISRAKAFGWSAQTSVEQGIAKTYEYFIQKYA